MYTRKFGNNERRNITIMRANSLRRYGHFETRNNGEKKMSEIRVEKIGQTEVDQKISGWRLSGKICGVDEDTVKGKEERTRFIPRGIYAAIKRKEE